MRAKSWALTVITFSLAAAAGCGSAQPNERRPAKKAGLNLARAFSGQEVAQGPAKIVVKPRPTLRFDVQPPERVALLPNAVGPLAYAADGTTLITCSPGDDRSLQVWDLSGPEPKVRERLKGHTKLIWALAFSPDGKTLASCSLDETIRLWDIEADRASLRSTLKWDKGSVDAIAWGSATTLACSGGDDKRGGEDWFVRIWDVGGPKPRERTTFNGGTPLAIAPDGKTLAAAWAVDIQLWDLSGGEPVKGATLTGHSGTINAFAFAPDGKSLISVSKDSTVRIWDVATSDERAVCAEHGGPVVHVVWAPDGKLFATAGESGPARIILWNAQGKKLKQWLLPNNDVYGSHIAFSPDSRNIAFHVTGEGGSHQVYILRAAP